jgi:hypothetical protein
VKVHLNKDAVELIVDGLSAGSSAAAVLAGLEAAGIITAPKAAVTALIAAIGFLGASVFALLDVCNGVNLRIWWTGQVWPWSA